MQELLWHWNVADGCVMAEMTGYTRLQSDLPTAAHVLMLMLWTKCMRAFIDLDSLRQSLPCNLQTGI